MTRILLTFVFAAGALHAHSMNQAAILLDFQDRLVDAEVQLPLARLEAATGLRITPSTAGQLTDFILPHVSASLPSGPDFQIQTTAPPEIASVEGAPYVIVALRLTPPPQSSAELFDLHCDLLFARIPNQVFLVSVRTDWRAGAFANEPQLLGLLNRAETTIRLDRRGGSWWHGFGEIFRLGLRHIAEGTDHLLFLLVLLIPAPLLAVTGRWSKPASILASLLKTGKVVTAFTLGHSLTLAAGVINLIHVPSRPVEALIAISILVSAIHAFRPMFPGRETLIASGFGLIHGLAFASTLAELGLGRWERVASILAFNLGIETMQLVAVAAVLPSFILLSRTRLYPPVRIAGALFAAVAAAGWVGQRLWDAPNPTDVVVTTLAQHAVWIALGLTLLGLAAFASGSLRVVPRPLVRQS